MVALASDWLRHFRLLLWNCWTEFNQTWQEARSQCPLRSLCLSGRSEKQDGHPGLWLAETFLTSPQKLLKGIQRNWTETKCSTSSTKFVFFGPIKKTIWQPWPLIGWDIFWLFLWNRWMEFSETWQEARSQCPLPSLCLSGWKVNKNDHTGQSVKKGCTLYSGARYVALWVACLWNKWHFSCTNSLIPQIYVPCYCYGKSLCLTLPRHGTRRCHRVVSIFSFSKAIYGP